MDRRKFLGTSIKACAATAFTSGVMQSSFASSAIMQAISASCTDSILILVQLNGGNDGLNTIIPLDQYSLLSAARSNVLVPENSVLQTTQYAQTGFHPSFTDMHQLFEANKFSIVQGCSYDNPDLSHFRATDIWMSGSNADEFLRTGWAGRNLDQLYADWPNDYPNAEHPDPLAIQMGSSTALALEGGQASFGLATTSISRDYALLSGFGDAVPETYAGCELDFIRTIAVNTDAYNARILEAANNQKTNLSSKYGSGNLSSQLKNVARLIKGGMKTRVYMVSLMGFDTHANQVDNSTTTGSHASLLTQVNEAIRGFQDDIELMGVNKRVTGMIFSEFGRRVKSNGSKGTDHGTAMPVMLFGTELVGDMYGTNPDLLKPGTTSTTVDNVPMQYDYRSVYYSLLKDWFCLSSSQLDGVFGGKQYQYISLFKEGSITANEEDVQKELTSDKLYDIYPNVVDQSAIIPFNSAGGEVQLNLYDIEGHLLRTMIEKNLPSGPNRFTFERQGLRSGTYIIEMITDTTRQTKKMILI